MGPASAKGRVARDEEVARVGKELAPAARDRDIDIGELGDQVVVLRHLLQVRGEDDDVRPRGLEVRDLGLHGREDRTHDDAAREGDGVELLGRRADDADVEPVHAEHRARDELAHEARLGRRIEVRAQQRNRRGEAIEEVLKDARPEVELVVARDKRVVADEIEGDRIEVRHALVEARLELRTGEDVVARGQQDDAARDAVVRWVGERLGPQVVDDAGEARDAAEVLVRSLEGEQLALAVGMVQDGQDERGLGSGDGAEASNSGEGRDARSVTGHGLVSPDRGGAPVGAVVVEQGNEISGGDARRTARRQGRR
jgi:hypothetical protein